MKFQNKLYNILQEKFAVYCGLFFIIISIVAVIASSYEEMKPYKILLFLIIYASSFVFLAEYIARIVSAPAKYPDMKPYKARLKYTFSFFGFVDFVAILPAILTFRYWNTPIVHVLILPYVFTIFKLLRHSKSFRIIGDTLISVKDELITAYSACLILISFAAILMYYLEREAQPDVFRNIGQGFWWCVVTFTTTGYGDIYPITPLGKLIGGIISLIGIAMIALPTGIIGSAFMNTIQKRERAKIEQKVRKEMEQEQKEQQMPDK